MRKINAGTTICLIILLMQSFLSGCTPPKYKVEQNVPDQYFQSNSKIDLKVQLNISDKSVTSAFENIEELLGQVDAAIQMAESVFSEVIVTRNSIPLPDVDAVLMPGILFSTLKEGKWYKKMNMAVGTAWSLTNPSGKVIWLDRVEKFKTAPSTMVFPVAAKRMKNLSIEILGEIFTEPASLFRSSKRVSAYADNRYIAELEHGALIPSLKLYKVGVTTEEKFIEDYGSPDDLEIGKIGIMGCQKNKKQSDYQLGFVSERTFHALNIVSKDYQRCLNVTAVHDPFALKMRKGEIEVTNLYPSKKAEREVRFRTEKPVNGMLVEESAASTSSGSIYRVKAKSDIILYATFCTLRFSDNLLQRVSCE